MSNDGNEGAGHANEKYDRKHISHDTEMRSKDRRGFVASTADRIGFPNTR